MTRLGCNPSAMTEEAREKWMRALVRGPVVPERGSFDTACPEGVDVILGARAIQQYLEEGVPIEAIVGKWGVEEAREIAKGRRDPWTIEAES